MYTKYLLLAAILLFVLPAKISIGSTYQTESEVTKNIEEKQIVDNNSKTIKDFVSQHGDHNNQQQHDEDHEELEYHFDRIRKCRFRKLLCLIIHLFLIIMFEVVSFFNFPIPNQPLWCGTSQIHAPATVSSKLSVSYEEVPCHSDTLIKLPVHAGSVSSAHLFGGRF